jgi:hypothetical protein
MPPLMPPAVMIGRIRFWAREIAIFLLISLLLAVCQWLLPSGIFNPGPIVSLILLNFMNKIWETFFSSLLMMWVGLIFIFIFSLDTNKRRFWSSIIVIFILLPIIFQVLNLLILNAPSVGYSGIAAVFLGYGTYSLLQFLHNCWKSGSAKKWRHRAIIGLIFIFPLLLFIFLVDPNEPILLLQHGIYGVIETAIQTKTDIPIHVIGYLCGFIIPHILQ